jgi:hypothetical protein
MTAEQCFMGVCFMPLEGSGQKFFGFSELLAGLALMVLAWTIADVRYRFRVRTAPLPLLGITYSVVAAVGVLTLLTDLWRAEQWLVPKGHLLTPALWQAIMGGLFLLTFLTWAWFAFIRPPIYGRYNAERFAQTLYHSVLKGSPTELAVIADEVAYSAEALVRHATDKGRFKNYARDEEEEKRKLKKVEEYANDLLLLIADKRLCRVIVESSPVTALAVFQAMADMKKYGIQVETFAGNIVAEALANEDSFVYHEAEGYESGLIGYHKPLSQAMFANYYMVETIGTLLDPGIYGRSKWAAAQWRAYCRLTLMTFSSYVNEGYGGHSFVLYRAMSHIQGATSDLYTLNENKGSWETDSFSRLNVVVEFIKDTIKILDEKGVPDHIRLRIRNRNGPGESFFDHIASLILEVIYHASAIRSPQWECWSIQHNSVWFKLFNFSHLDGPAGKVVKFKVKRLLYDEIVNVRHHSGFRGARILGFCLNVMGLTEVKAQHDKDSRALQKAVLAWTRKNFLSLHGYNPRLAAACMVDGLTLDLENRRLVRTSPAEGLRREPSYVYFELDPVSVEPDSDRVAVGSTRE